MSNKVKMSRSAVISVQAALQHTVGRTDEEQQYDQMVASCVPLPHEHVQKPAPTIVLEHNGIRLYAITTIAASQRFGGTRTVTVCETFAQAKKFVERNVCDIYERSYKLAVIEGIVAGWPYYVLDEQYWYLWKGALDGGGYVPIVQPKPFEGVTHIGGIG